MRFAVRGGATAALLCEANAADVAAAKRKGRSTTRLVASEKLRRGMIDGLRGWATAPSRRGEVRRRCARASLPLRTAHVTVVGADGRARLEVSLVRAPFAQPSPRGAAAGAGGGVRRWGAVGLVQKVLERVEHEGWALELLGAELGVVGFVFEGRPNVLADATGVLRGGNTVVFRIGSDALGTARAIMRLALAPALAEARRLPARDPPAHFTPHPCRRRARALVGWGPKSSAVVVILSRTSVASGCRSLCRRRRATRHRRPPGISPAARGFDSSSRLSSRPPSLANTGADAGARAQAGLPDGAVALVDSPSHAVRAPHALSRAAVEIRTVTSEW